MLVAFVGLGAAFVGLLVYLARHQEDQSYLTEHIDAKVLATRDLAENWGVIYSYQVDGQTYYTRTSINIRYARPVGTISICVDPHNPARNAIAAERSCGSSTLDSGTDTAKTTRPSW